MHQNCSPDPLAGFKGRTSNASTSKWRGAERGEGEAVKMIYTPGATNPHAATDAPNIQKM